jgi:hypothetical protein
MVDLVFPIPSIENFGEFVKYIDQLTDVGMGGILGILILMIFGSVLFLMLKSYGTEKSAGVTFFITGIIGVMLRIFATSDGWSLINNYTLTIVILLSVLGLYMLLRESAKQDL